MRRPADAGRARDICTCARANYHPIVLATLDGSLLKKAD
jgi:hypothetical protein